MDQQTLPSGQKWKKKISRLDKTPTFSRLSLFTPSATRGPAREPKPTLWFVTNRPTTVLKRRHKEWMFDYFMTRLQT